MRQFKPGQLQTGSLYNISSSYALTASFATNLNPNATASYAINAETASYVNPLRQNVQITGSLYFPDNTHSIYFSGSGAASRLTWNDTDGTLDLGLKGGNVTLQVGQEEIIRVVNKTGADLLESQYRAVRIRSVGEGGAQGQRLAVVLAQADNDANSATTIGIVTENITNNQEGFITTFGKVRGINTTGTLQGETWVDGDMLYLSPNTPGYITNIKPQAPQHTVILGYVVYAHQNNGIIFVKVDNGYEIDELHNVRITTSSLSSGDLLVYSGSVWTNTKQLTGSYGLTGSLAATAITASNARITGNVQILGTASISVLNVTYESASIIYSSGSNQFGDAANDTQTLWGTVDVKSGPLLVTGSVQSTGGFTGSFSGSVAAPGSTTQIVYNNGGVLDANSGFVYSGSRVGIGVSSPSHVIQVVGTSRLSNLLIGALGNNAISNTNNDTSINLNGGVGIAGGSLITPSARLQVRGSGATSSTTALRVENTNASASLVVLDNGYVGIGTGSAQYQLDVYGNYHQYQAQGLLARYDISSANANQNRGVWDFYTNAAASPDFFGRFGFKFEGGTADSFKQFQIHVADSTTPKLVVDGAGRVGIGTITPTASLDIRGTQTAAGSIARTMLISSSLSASANNDVLVGIDIVPSFNTGSFTGITSTALRVAGNINPSTNGIIDIGSPSAAFNRVRAFSVISPNALGLYFSGGTLGLQIFATGNTVIQNGGTFTDRGYRLDVSGSGNFTNNLTVTGSTTLTNGQTTIRGTGVTSATTALRVENSNSTPTLVALDNGYVGIGTSTPSASLQISGSNPLLRLNGSGSELMSVDGASGRLFTVSDDLSNSLFSVNTISGLPVIEAYATNDVYIGKFNTYPIKTTASGTLAVITGSFTGSIVGTIIGTASFATQALTASFASTASYLNTLNQDLTFNGNLTLNGTASISNLVVNQIAYSSGSNQLGDAADDTQTLYGSVIIPTGSLTVSGSSTFRADQNATPITITGYVATGSAAQPALDITGSWNTSGTPTLIRANVTNTTSNASSLLMDLQVSGTRLFSVGIGNNTVFSRNGFVFGGTLGNSQIVPIDSGGTFSNSGRAIRLGDSVNTTDTGYQTHIISPTTQDRQFTSGEGGIVAIGGVAFVRNFNPTSGTGVFNILNLTQTINQTGGANGITRGLYVNPTLTSAFSWRSIEWSNNTGFGLYGVGGATNYLSGSLGIRTTTPSASLHISGASSANLLRIDSPASSSIVFVSGSGNVGIGTNTPLYTLDVSGSTYSRRVLVGNDSGSSAQNDFYHRATNGGVYFTIRDSNNNSRLYFTGQSGTSQMIAVSQNIGLGVYTPTSTNRVTIGGLGATSATTALRVENLNTSASLTITDDLNSQFFGNVGIQRAATASLDVAGTTRISGSFNTAASGSILTVIGSGSAQPIFTVQGSQGELFSITDSLSGSLFSVNDISGLPILEVFSDNTTLIGNYQDPMLITTAKVIQTNSGSFTVYSLPTASYDTAFFEYSIKSGSNARAGTIMAMQLGSSVNFTETTTTDFGDTSAVSFIVIVTGSNMALTGSSTTGSWTTKCIVRGL